MLGIILKNICNIYHNNMFYKNTIALLQKNPKMGGEGTVNTKTVVYGVYATAGETFKNLKRSSPIFCKVFTF